MLDTSGFIKIENKLKYFIIVCGITNALNIVNIPYAINLIGDSQVQCTIKSFRNEHSMMNLQRVLDCFFIKRFISKYVNGVKYALQKVKPERNNTYRTILLFSDGLDEDLVLIDQWKNQLLDKNNSYGFFFINSEGLVNTFKDDYIYLSEKWRAFEKE